MGNLNFQDVIRDVHDPSLHALQTTATLSASTVYVGNPTLYAVVNTSAAGDSTAKIGFVTAAISTPTLFAVVNTSAAGVGNSIVTVANPNFGINAGVNGIGFATVNQVNQPALVASNANIGSVSILGGGIGINTGLNNIGFATVAVSTPTLFAVVNTGAAGVGNSIVTVANPNFGINAGVNGIGFATVNVAAIAAGVNYVGLVSVNIGGTLPALSAGIAGIGFATVKVDAGTQFIGLVTAVTRNAGTNKTLINLPVGFSASSITTIAIPTNANSVYVTNLLLNSNATVRVTLKSGATYLTGNASIGITLNPGGGLVMTGSPDSPSWIGLPSGALVIEKLDLTATAAQIAGNVVYFQE